MIIDIALGIVLAILIFRFWPIITALGLVATITGALFLLGIGVIYFVSSRDAALQKVITISILAVIVFLGTLLSQVIAKRTVLKAEEIGVLLTITVFLTSTTLLFLWLIPKWALEAGEPQPLLYLLPLIALWAWLWKRLSGILKKRITVPVLKPEEFRTLG